MAEKWEAKPPVAKVIEETLDTIDQVSEVVEKVVPSTKPITDAIQEITQTGVKLVKMWSENSDGERKEADVHPDEVANWSVCGWNLKD